MLREVDSVLSSVPEIWFALWAAAVGITVALLFGMTLLAPNRNHVTRWIVRYLERTSLLFSARTACLLIATGSLALSVLVITAALLGW